VVGPTTKELDSLNELIKFDHEYYKIEPINTVEVISGKSVSKVNLPEVICGSDTKISQVNSINIYVTADLDQSHAVPVTDAVKEEKKEVSIPDNSQLNVIDSSALPEISMEFLSDIEDLLTSELQGDLSVSDNTSVLSTDNYKVVHDNLQGKTTSHIRCAKRKLSDLLDNIDNVPETLPTDLLDVDAVFSPSYSNSDSFSDAASPCSDTSGGLEDNLWEESFMELFPTLA